MITRRFSLLSLAGDVPMPPLPATPLPEAAITLLRYSAHWVAHNFDPSESEPMIPALMHIDQDGVVEGVAVLEVLLEEKPKLGARVTESIAAYPATAFVTEAWVSLPKTPRPSTEEQVIIPPRCDLNRIEVVEITLWTGGRQVCWTTEILRSNRPGLRGWKILCDTAQGMRFVPTRF